MAIAGIGNVGPIQAMSNALSNMAYRDSTVLKYFASINTFENSHCRDLLHLIVSKASAYIELAGFLVDNRDRSIPRELYFLPALIYFDTFANPSSLLRYTNGKKRPVIPYIKIRGLDENEGDATISGKLFAQLRKQTKPYVADGGYITYGGISGPYWKIDIHKHGLLTTESSPDVLHGDELYISRPSLHVCLDMSGSQLDDLLKLAREHKAYENSNVGGYGRGLILRYIADNKLLRVYDEQSLHNAEYPLYLNQVVECFRRRYVDTGLGAKNPIGKDDVGSLTLVHMNFSGGVFDSAKQLWKDFFSKESQSLESALATGSSNVVLTRLVNMAAQQAVRNGLAKSSDGLYQRALAYFKGNVKTQSAVIGTDGKRVETGNAGYAKRLTKALFCMYESEAGVTAEQFFSDMEQRKALEEKSEIRERYANGPSMMLSVEV